jgi:hypothetical protein
MFLVWLQSRCSPQGHRRPRFSFCLHFSNSKFDASTTAPTALAEAEGQTGFACPGKRSAARLRGGARGTGEPVSVLYNGPWFTRSKPRGEGRASSPAEADHELLLVRGGFRHRPKRRAPHVLALREWRKVEPRHVKCQQAEPIVVRATRRWAGAAIAHPAEVVHCLMGSNRSPAAYARSRRTYVEDRPVTECAAGRIGIIDDQSEAFRAGRRAVPGEGWRHVLAFAGIDVWYSALSRRRSV